MDADRPFSRFFADPGHDRLHASTRPPFRTADASRTASEVALTAHRHLRMLARDLGVGASDVEQVRRLLHGDGRTGGAIPDWQSIRQCVAFGLGALELNFWKAYTGITNLDVDTSGVVVDIGAGSAAASLAVVAHAASTGRVPSAIILNDQSPAQLTIGRETLRRR